MLHARIFEDRGGWKYPLVHANSRCVAAAVNLSNHLGWEDHVGSWGFWVLGFLFKGILDMWMTGVFTCDVGGKEAKFGTNAIEGL